MKNCQFLFYIQFLQHFINQKRRIMSDQQLFQTIGEDGCSFHQFVSIKQLSNDQISCPSTSSKGFNVKFDEMLEHSYIDTQKNKQKQPHELINTYQISGQSFFRHTNGQYYSQISKSKLNKNHNKKMQCQIGSGIYWHQNSKSLLGKAKRLQILKIIKLIKVLLKFLRLSQHNLAQQMHRQTQKNAVLFKTMKFELSKVLKSVDQEMKQKDKKIQQLQDQVIRVSLLYNQLSTKIEQDKVCHRNQLRQMYQEHQKRIHSMMKDSETLQMKNEQLLERNSQLQNMVHNLEIQLNNSHYQNQNYEVEQKRLDYQNNALQQEIRQLNQKLQNVLKERAQNEIDHEQQDDLLLANYSQLKQAKNLNEVYLKEIQLTKRQSLLVKQEFSKLEAEKQQCLNIELNRYQDYFNTQMEKITKELRQNIREKDKIIEKMKDQQKIYMKMLINSKLTSHDQSSKSDSNSISNHKISDPTNHTPRVSNYKMYPNNNLHRISQKSRRSYLDSISDKFMKTATSTKSRFSQCVMNNTQKNFGLNFMYANGKQYMTHNQGFGMVNTAQSYNKQAIKNKYISFTDKRELLDEKMKSMEQKLLKLNKSLDYKNFRHESY